ncbi:MAG: nicotinate-nucleotide adenylyltransferase [Pseudomonadota bacterium]
MRQVLGASAFEADREWLRVPPVFPGMTVGLFGGSFNPPHQGHRNASLTALKRCGLSEVWWLVTPGNPLKDHRNLAPLEARVMRAAAVADHPRIRVTAFEAAAGLSFTADTIRYLTDRRHQVRFVWIMGADNLSNFHHWQDWRSIMARVAVVVIDRPGDRLAASSAPAAQAYRRFRVDEREAASLAWRDRPAWMFLKCPLDPSSSTELRKTNCESA